METDTEDIGDWQLLGTVASKLGGALRRTEEEAPPPRDAEPSAAGATRDGASRRAIGKEKAPGPKPGQSWEETSGEGRLRAGVARTKLGAALIEAPET